MSESSQKMNPDIKRLWVDALRSGHYKQGREELRNLNDEYDPLGVLCDLHARIIGGEWWEGALRYIYGHSVAALPPVVMDWAGLSKSDPYIDFGGKRDVISLVNDRGATFFEIADAIEASL